MDWREQIDMDPEREPVDDGPAFNRLIGPNLCSPSSARSWRSGTLSGVARKLLRAWALTPGTEESYFEQNFGEPSTLIEIVRYPGTHEPEPQQGVGAHKDHAALGRARQGRAPG